MTDLSKTFDCLSHDLITKLNSYGFSFSSARLIHSYLPDIKQRTKINSTYSSGTRFSLVSNRVLSLGRSCLTFLSFILSYEWYIYFVRYVDDNTPYVIGKIIKEVNEALENSSKELMEWFSNNQVNANADKCHLLTSSNEVSTICIDNENYYK